VPQKVASPAGSGASNAMRLNLFARHAIVLDVNVRAMENKLHGSGSEMKLLDV
jgi:hypothetical protein